MSIRRLAGAAHALSIIAVISALWWAIDHMAAKAQLVPSPGPPIAIACAYNSSPPTVPTSNAVWVQCDSSGHLSITQSGGSSAGAFGSTIPVNGDAIGADSSGLLTAIIQADQSAAINISTATTTQIVALSASKKIYVSALDVVAGGTGNITFEYGTGSNCGTGTTALTGPYNLTAQAGLSKGSGLGSVLIVPAGNALCALTSAGVQMSGSIAYTQF